MNEKIKKEIEDCTTEKQARAILKKYGLKIQKDDTQKYNRFSVWTNENTRIYQPYGRKNMTVQTWHKTELKYSGIPTFF